MKKILIIIEILIIMLILVMPTNVLALSNNVFLNGQTGADTKDGSSPTNAVKTFAKAKELLSVGGTIWITGQVTISSDETWDLKEYGVNGTNGIIKRWDGISVPFTSTNDKKSYTEALIYVNEEVLLTLNELIIDGNKDNIEYGNSLIRSMGNLNIDNCTLQNSKAKVSGTAITLRLGNYLSYRPTVKITNSNFNGNEGIDMGSANGTIAYDKGKIEIENTTFENNSNYKGGVIVSANKNGIVDRTCRIIKSKFINNLGEKVIVIDANDNVTIESTQISYNDCTTNTVYLNGKSTLTISDSNINNNTALNGGGIYIANGSAILNINNTNIINNIATDKGGAIYLNSGKVNITESIITGNSSTSLGAGIYHYNYGTLNIQGKNEIFGNTNANINGDIYLPKNITIKIEGDITDSKIGVLAADKPNYTNSVDVAIPINSYVLNENYYKYFFANEDAYMTYNQKYNTSNNKVVLVKPYIVTFNYNGGVDNNGDTHGRSQIYPVRNLTTDDYIVPQRHGYTFNGWKDENGNILTDLTSEYINSDKNYIAMWTQNDYTVTFTTTKGGILTNGEEQNVKYENKALAGVMANSISSEYEFVGWNYDYVAEDGTSKSGTVLDYTTVEIYGDVEFKAVFLKKPFISVISAGNGKVAISKSGDQTPTKSFDSWEIDTSVDSLPTNGVINYKADEGYELKKITFEDLYGHTYEVDISKTDYQLFPTGNEDPLKNTTIKLNQNNNTLSITGIETTLKYNFEFKKINNIAIEITNQFYGNFANVNDYCIYTVTGTMNGQAVTKQYELSSGESVKVGGFDEGTNYTIIQQSKTDYLSSVSTTVKDTQEPTISNLQVTGTFNSYDGVVTAEYSNTRNMAPNTGVWEDDNNVLICIISIAVLLFIVLIKFKKR